MFKETARRIGEGLLASKEEGGTLKWLQGYQVPHPLLEAAREPSPVSSDKSNSRQVSAHVSGEKSDGISTSAPSVTAGPTAVKKNDSHFTDATAFLKDGFEELLKCRCVSIFCVDRFIFLNQSLLLFYLFFRRYCNGLIRMRISSLSLKITTTTLAVRRSSSGRGTAAVTTRPLTCCNLSWKPLWKLCQVCI